MQNISYQRHRFHPDIIRHAVWLYFRFTMAKTMDKGTKIVTVIVDRRDRYFAEYPNEHYVV